MDQNDAFIPSLLQVLWLSGENEELTEVGTMNIFVLWKNEEGDLELVTPPLDRGISLISLFDCSCSKFA